MDTRVWYKAEDTRGAVLALTGDALHRLEFSGKNAKAETMAAATALLEGQAPTNIAASGVKTLPLAAIRRVEVSADRDTVKFHSAQGDAPVAVDFSVKSGDDGPGLARAVVERTPISHPERSEDVSVVEALTPPVILGVILGVLWGILYVVATGVENGEDVEVNQGGRRGRGLKRIFAFAAQILGVNGTIAVGVILLALFITWGVRRVVKRPQRLVWGPAAA